MKKLFYLMAVASLFLAMPLTSCSDDDDDDNGSGNTELTDEPKTLNLTGALNVTVGGDEQPAVNQAIILTDNADGTISLTISNFSFMGFDFGNIVIENCELGEDGSFSGDATVTYDLLSLNIPLTITGTYDGSNVKFSSTFKIAELSDLEVSFTYDSSVQVTESDDQGSSFVQPEGSTAYTGTLSGSAMGIAFGPDEATIYYNGNTIAMEKLAISISIFGTDLDLNLSNMYIDIEPDNDGNFKDGTAEAYLETEYMEMEGVKGSVVVDGDDITINASLPVEAMGMELTVEINFTTKADPFEITDDSLDELYGFLTTSVNNGTTTNDEVTAVTITYGLNGNGYTVYSLPIDVSLGSFSGTLTRLTIVDNGDGSYRAQVTKKSVLGTESTEEINATVSYLNNTTITASFSYTSGTTTYSISLYYSENSESDD